MMPMSFPTTGTQTDVLSKWAQSNQNRCCVDTAVLWPQAHMFLFHSHMVYFLPRHHVHVIHHTPTPANKIQ